MSIEGRISVDVLFHDKDGTSAVNVVSLSKSDEYSTGLVSVVTGTVDANGVTFYPSSYGFSYRNAAGDLVVFESVNRVALVGSDVIAQGVAADDVLSFSIYSSGEAAATRSPYELNSLTVRAANETSTYTLVVYGQ